MKPSDIKEQHIYCNRGKGKTLRFVLRIGSEHAPEYWYSDSPRPDESGVRYRDSKGRESNLYISSFASWCGKCIGRAVGDSFELFEDVHIKKLEHFKDL